MAIMVGAASLLNLFKAVPDHFEASSTAAPKTA
jgi:hypothetical protein